MIKIKWLLGLIVTLGVYTQSTVAQNDCPSLPSRAKFDTLGYISANIPTDPSSPAGKLYLAQGQVQRGAQIRPGYIPNNKPSWAIGIAVAWNLARNLNQRVEYPNINYWMATLIQETELRCVTGLTWDDPSHVPDAYNPATVYAAQINNGCLQIEGPGAAWSALQQAYPNGRIPFDNTLYDQLIEGVDGFEASALTKTYYDAYTSQIFNYNVGWDFYNNVDCKRNNGYDPYAYEKMSASNYNGGPNAYLNAKTILDQTGPGNWTGLPATTAGYANDIAKWISVLDGNTGYAEYPGGASAKGPDYDGAVPYSEVTKYLNIIQPMYSDVNFATELIPAVEAAFIAKAGSLAGTINFSDFGDVIDAIVLNLPMDKPTPVDGSPMGVDLGCSGDFLPYGHVDILNGGTTLCLGESVTLELSVDAGNDPNIEFKWFKGDVNTGTLISTEKIITITPTALGTDVYSGQICNANGCYTVYSNTQNACQDDRNLNGFTVTANDCNLCPFVASGTSVNAVCKGTPDGSITLNLVNDPANYEVSYIATTAVGNDTVSFETSGNTVQIYGVRDGAYNIILTDLNDPDCKARTTVIVGYDTEINEYIDADILAIADCEADLGSEIKELPTPCLWKVRVHTPIVFQWEAWVNALVSTSTGKTLVQKQTRIAPKPEVDDWNDTPVSEFYLSLNTGDQITVGTALTTTPGASQLRTYEFNIFDEADNNVYTAQSTAGSSTFGNNDVAGTYTVTCPQTVPDYTIAWTPNLNDLVTTTTTSNGTADVKSDDRVYTVTATNNTNPQCILKDSVVVMGDPTCVSSCAFPGDVTLVDVNDVKLTDSIIACADSTIFTILDGGDPGTFLYELYKDGAAQIPAVTNNTGEFTLSEDGVYHVLVSDDANPTDVDCQVSSDTITFVQKTAPTPPSLLSGNTTVCAGSFGELYEVDSIVGVDYTWVYRGENADFNPLNPTDTFGIIDFANTAISGDLVVQVSNICGIDSLVEPITVNPVPEADLGNDTAICFGSSLMLNSGSTGLDYEWIDGSMNEDLLVDTANTYWVIVTDNGCSDTDSIVVTIKPLPTVDLGNDTTLCGGTLNLDVSGIALPGLTYEWSDLGNTSEQYLVTATESDIWVAVTLDGCSDTDSINVTINAVPVVDLGNDTTFCFGGSTVLDAGNTGLDFEWIGGTTDQTLLVDTTNIYWVAVTENGCSDTDSVVVTVNAVPVVDLGNDTSICAGDVTFDATTAGAAYLWQDYSTNATYVGDATEDVWVIVTVNNCSDTDSVALNVGGELLISVGNDTAICANQTPFELSVANYATIAWEDEHGTIGAGTTFNVDSTSLVWIEVADVTGCVGRDTILVTVNELPEIDLGNDTSVCASSGGLSLDANFAGAIYVWEPNGETAADLTVTTSGEYKVELTSADGCVYRDSITVTVLGSAVLDLGPTDTALCSHLGGLTLDAGAGFTSYDWSTNATNQSITVNNSGEYRVIVEDANGCIARDSIEVTVNTTPVVNLGGDTTTICATSPAATFDATTAGATYNWSSGETTASIQKGTVDEGDYWVIVTVNGCSDSDSVHLKVATELTVDLGADQEICTGTQATLTVGGFGAGFTFAWNGGAAGTNNSFTGGAGTYDVVVSDAGGCSGNDQITITEVNPLSIDLGADQTICAGNAAVTFGMQSGRTDLTIVDWNGDNTITDLTFTTNQTGTYTLNVDSAGCTASASVDLTVNALPVVSLGADTFICAGTTPIITLDAGAFMGYQWVNITNPLAPIPMGTNQTQNVSTVGTYGVVVTNVNGCVNGDTIVVGEQQSTLFSLPNDTSICPGGSIIYDVPANLQAANNGSWEWTLDNSTGLSYTVQNQNDGDQFNLELVFTNEFGCVSSDEVLVDINNNLPVGLTGATICEGDDVTISSGFPAAGFTFLWQDGSTGNDLVLTGTSLADAGAVSVDVVNTAAGCSGTGNAILTVNALPNPQLSANPICAGEDRVLDHGLTGVSQVWDHGPTENPTVVLSEDRYRVTVTDGNGCEDTVSVYLTVNQAPLLNLPSGGVLCEGENNTLNTGFDEALYTHQWSGVSTATTAEIAVTQGGVYAVTVTENATQCSASDQAEFVFNTVPNVDLGNDTNICVGEFVTIFSNETDPSYTYEWNTGEINLASINVDQTGWVWLDVSNGVCSGRDSIAVTVFDNPLSALRNDTVFCIDDEQNGLVQLDPGRDAAGTTYRWSTGDTTQVIFANEPGFFEVTITNAAGCETYDFVTIKEDCPAHVWLPLGFTPNDDGLNDRWEIRGRNIEFVEVLLYNRWGEFIWQGNEIGESWDGTHLGTGNAVQQDVYVYYLKYMYLNVEGGKEWVERVGRVTVVK